MSSEAKFVPSGRRYRVRTAEERERAFRSAKRHSRVVGILSKVLPVLAVLVLGCSFISTRLSVSVGDLTASISGIQIADGNLRMTNPKLQGNDKKNGSYVVSAEYADQDMKNQKMIKLHAIKADLSSANGGWSRMEAVRGIFNSEAERLVMQGKINVGTSSGGRGGERRAEEREPRHEKPDAPLASSGPLRIAQWQREGQCAHVPFRGAHSHLPRQGDGPPRQAGRR